MKASLLQFFLRPLRAPRFVKRAAAAFTLVEMLVVMGVIVIIISAATPAITGLSRAGDVSKSVYDLAGILEQARAYAMSNNTYVYVGFHEADANTSESARQTEVAAPGVGGRVSVAVIASKDGTRGYDSFDANLASSWSNKYGTGGNFLTIGKVQHFGSIHIVDLDDPPTTGGMARGPYTNGTPVKVVDAYNLGSSTCQSVIFFEYPLGNTKGNGLYTFVRVIQYDPQGVARIQTASNTDTIVKLIEIGLEPSHGSSAPDLPKPAITGNIAALQIECMTGSTHIYRP